MRRGLLFIIGAALLWSSGGIGIKSLQHIGPLTVTFYRSLFAAMALFALFRGRVFQRRWRSTTAFSLAILCYAACLTSFVVATIWTTAANAIFLQYAGVIWVMLLSPVVLREPMRSRDAIAIGIAIVGMALFFVGKLDTNGMAGNAMALLSSIFFAGLVLALRREPEASPSAVTWGNVVLVAALLPFVHSKLALDGGSLRTLALLGVFQIGVAYALFVRGLRDVPATQASLTGMIEPVANPIWVFLVLGERPSPFAIGGAAIVLAAIAWHTVTSEPVADLPPPD